MFVNPQLGCGILSNEHFFGEAPDLNTMVVPAANGILCSGHQIPETTLFIQKFFKQSM